MIFCEISQRVNSGNRVRAADFAPHYLDVSCDALDYQLESSVKRYRAERARTCCIQTTHHEHPLQRQLLLTSELRASFEHF